MNISYIIAALFFCAQSLYAQLPPSSMNKKIKLSSNELRVDSLLQQLREQSSVQFSFNSRKIPGSKKIKFTTTRLSTQEILSKLEQVFGIKYIMVGGHVILMDEEKGNETLTSIRRPNNKAQHIITKNEPAKEVNTVNNTHDEIIIKRIDSAVPLQRSFYDTLPMMGITEKRLSKIVVPSATIKATGNSTPIIRPKKVSPFFRNMYFEIGTRGAGLNFDLPIRDNFSIELSTGLGAGYFVTGRYFYYTMQLKDPAYYFSVIPTYHFDSNQNGSSFNLGVQFKYHSAQLFSNNGTPIDSNAKWISQRGYTNAGIFFDLHAGFEKPFGERWKFKGHAGIGYAFSTATTGLNHWYPAIGAKLCYRLKK